MNEDSKQVALGSGPYRRKPCSDCPWRRDVPPGNFPPEAFQRLAKSCYDQAWTVFACHQSKEERPVACAGFLLRGAEHNLWVRVGLSSGNFTGVADGGHDLYGSYREMAEANGVPATDPALARCRGERDEER